MKRDPRVLNRRHDHIGRRAVLVDRTTKWGNPFVTGDRESDIASYRRWLFSVRADLVGQAGRKLAGRDLVCWCAPLPCHADTLLEIARLEGEP